MGLDMYLEREHYVGAEFEHRQVKANIKITIKGVPLVIDPKKLSYIKERVAYWRKANQIHKWFVDNVQDGEDECNPHDVSGAKLLELVDLCKKAIKKKDPSLLPPQSGFFFGSTEIGDWYWEDLKDTIKQLKDVDPDGDYVYRSSW